MSRTSTPPPTANAARDVAGKNKPEAESPRRPEGHRDLVEQIVVAFILAFLVRGFAAEAFVIPTGSMAPTLRGMHKDVVCPYCSFEFTVNASEEFDQRGAGRRITSVVSGRCGNCQAPVQLDDGPSFNGDRILVMKFLYNLPFISKDQPRRWEVVVFHYPEEPETNYIKRLVGMPGEDLKIHYGDVLRRDLDSEGPFELLRKPLRHLDAMQMNVWDDRRRPRVLQNKPEWRRWQPRGQGRWEESQAGSFSTPTSEDWSELGYQHLVPDPTQWEAILGGKPLPYPPRPRLVSDFYPYNSGSPFRRQVGEPIAPHWVGDLGLQLRAETRASKGTFRVDLIRSGVPHRAEFDIATGQATLFRGDEPLGPPAPTPFKGPGSHDIRLVNFDGRLTLWVDGRTIFGDGLIYRDSLDGYEPPTEDDLEPVRLAVRDADLKVTDLVLSRDIYYTVDPGSWDYEGLGMARSTTLSDPSEFSLIGGVRSEPYPIQPGRYLMLGDNSPRSKDGRGWSQRDRDWDADGGRQAWEVPEDLLIGKAFFIYWPHARPIWPSIPINRNLRIPFWPSFDRMRWIR